MKRFIERRRTMRAQLLLGVSAFSHTHTGTLKKSTNGNKSIPLPRVAVHEPVFPLEFPARTTQAGYRKQDLLHAR